MKTLLILLLFCSTLQAQTNCFRDVLEQNIEYWSPAPIESYVTGAMLIGTFITVDLAQPYVTVQQRNCIAYTCMATSFLTYAIIRHIRLKKNNKKTCRY